MQPEAIKNVAVIGAGSWGTALAQASAVAGRRVTLVCRDPEQVAEINTRHTNSRALGALPLDAGLVAALALPADVDLAILAVPAQQSAAALGVHGRMLGGLPVVLSAKGLEAGTLRRQSEILLDLVPTATPLVLSGPSFAEDVAAGRPTAVTLASPDGAMADAVAAALAGPGLRLYAAGDMIGVELAGGLKNVYALACGAVEGAGLGASARAALIARAFAEMARLVVALGGNAGTLTGLAGLGDLTLSCTSAQSRNYATGLALGRGEILVEGRRPLAEGVFTAPVAQAIARRQGVDVPLIDAVVLLLSGRAAIADIVSGLMSRPLKRED
ncbi:glycerol-3-phosphate dehydrogenase (NAD(P)+) [Devosia enhydra]|uniref:Glycerol-3-phosphate dehydrogenase [NAD(P)+] n=1 Tax=Devosia enhydra TaxID=665118 RepID=A0A1K2HZ81_9HYPH|nr:NAD(P)H-dependent glycerol-3-phosphate dehydrogenase [Devosia enhydra]SFZ85392.1 glycerol-3-phosphate dehydrogenase (NAD(P)+) [Devosia enhydra]